MKVVWEMLSDKSIWSLLSDMERDIDKDASRLIFIELFNRLKLIEEENMALRVLLIEEGAVDKKLYKMTLDMVREYLQKKDEEMEKESSFFASSGVPFSQWVNFKLCGKFQDRDREEHKPN